LQLTTPPTGAGPTTPVKQTAGHGETAEPDIPSPKGKGAVCNHCGFVSALMNKCQRCNRRWCPATVRIVDVPPVATVVKTAPAPVAAAATGLPPPLAPLTRKPRQVPVHSSYAFST